MDRKTLNYFRYYYLAGLERILEALRGLELGSIHRENISRK